MESDEQSKGRTEEKRDDIQSSFHDGWYRWEHLTHDTIKDMGPITEEKEGSFYMHEENYPSTTSERNINKDKEGFVTFLKHK